MKIAGIYVKITSIHGVSAGKGYIRIMQALSAAESVITVREKTACFTGHRPEKLPFSVCDEEKLNKLKSVIYKHVYGAALCGYDTFFCGMQRGVDIWAGIEVLRVKLLFPDIRLICVCPYEVEYRRRTGADEAEYSMLIAQSSAHIVIGDRPSVSNYHVRNRFMVDRSSLVIGAIAVDGSGTSSTLNYAARSGVKIDKIDLNRLDEQ